MDQQSVEERSAANANNNQRQQNRYAHLVSSANGAVPRPAKQAPAPAPISPGFQSTSGGENNNQQHINNQNNLGPGSSNQTTTAANKPLANHQNHQSHQSHQSHQNHQRGPAYANCYSNSFSYVDWREQWYIIKEKILEKTEEPTNQRRLILIIVCCALLLDNMLYMVIVPIIPDYLRSIGSWSTYTENAKWVRCNTTKCNTKWQRIGGNVIYEGEDSAVGFLFASKAIVQLFINPFSGAIIDRIGYEVPMMIGLTVMFFSTMVFACGQTYSILFLARSLQGVGSAFADTSGLAMIADRFTEENERQRALGIALAFISFGCLVAPPFGAVLYQGAGKEVPFIILSLVCLLDASLLLLVTPPGTFAQCLPGYRPPAPVPIPLASPPASSRNQPEAGSAESAGQPNGSSEDRKKLFQRQKSISRRQSMTVASAGEAPKGTPIYVLFRDPYIACCSGALIIANVSLAFLEPTISIWMRNTMPDLEEWQVGMIWLPAFFPHVFGVYLTVKLADKYPRYQWLIAAIGLVFEGISCLMVPFCSSFWSLMLPISLICFGLALIDTAILPTLGFLVDTRYVSVYGSIYAIADISYSLSYAIGPIIAGGIVEAIGFTSLNLLIAVVTLGYTPILTMLRTIHDYEPFEADQSGLKKKKAKELAPFGKFGRQVIDEEPEEDLEMERSMIGSSPGETSDAATRNTSGSDQQAGWEQPQQQSSNYYDWDQHDRQQQQQQQLEQSRYETPRWACPQVRSADALQRQPSLEAPDQVARKSVLVKKGSSSGGGRFGEDAGGSKRQQHTVKIVENLANDQDRAGNPFLAN